jgi:hypothetical protein
MGCGCGGSLKARRPVRSATGNHGVLNSLNSPAVPKSNKPAINEERRTIEKLRRDAILRALGRPS